MASDYKKIAEEHEKRYGWDAKPRRIYKKLYSDKTHFIYELIQNADDSDSGHLKLQLDSNALLVWNDGRQFVERDVRSICSLGSSDKDLTHIGTFGIGFKAVYNYTDLPEIYSDDERFRIRDFIKPEGIDEITPEIERLVNEGKTIFRLPFKDNPHQVDDIKHLKDRLCNLSKERPLLFLRHLERIEWKDERNAQTGFYSCHRHSYDKIQDVPDNESIELVNLTGSLECGNELSETFLVFCKKIHPPEDVIDKLLEQAEDEEDEEEQQRIQQSAEELQPIEVAFKLQDDGITAMDDNCVLFAYLPTQKETHLKFLVQARYQTTPARDNIPKPSENPWNEWLVQETADFLPEVLEHLKVAGLLEPSFFSVLPLKGKVENEFKPIAEALQKTMREKPFVPTQDGGYAKAETVFYPHRESLPQLIESSWLYPGSSWLHQDMGRSGHAFNVMKEAGVKEINVSHVLNWLEKQDLNWFENRCEKWLCSLYIYLNNQKSQLERINGLERIKKLPLIRLENGQHVCASNGLIFFPVEASETREEINPFLNDLPVLQSALLEAEDHDDIKFFLDRVLDVKALQPETLIHKWMIPQYSQSEKPSEKENISHVRYLFKIWDKLSGYKHRELKEKIRTTPILQIHNNVSGEISDYVAPGDTYLPQPYTDDADLETYFSVCDGDIWFVDHAYLKDDSNRKDWFQFLKAIGSLDTPRVDKVEVVGSDEECEKRGITRQRSTRPHIEGDSFKETYYSGYYDGGIVDSDFAGLLEVFAQISNRNDVNLSRSLWNLLIKVVEPLSPEKPNWSSESNRDAFFQCTYHRFYHAPQRTSFDATFYSQLKKNAWLPDEQGNFHQPSELFAPTDDNRRVLGNSVAYLNSDFNISQENGASRWLAEKLGIHLNANTENVLNYLQTLSDTETSVKKVEPLYRFLERQDARPREEFRAKPLILTSNPTPCWRRSDEVFWEDESAIFGNHRGYLKENYADYEATLKPFFIALGVSERASPSDYARVIRKVASVESADDDGIRESVKSLYRRLWQSLQEFGSWQVDEEWLREWKQTREDKCWLGKKGSEWGFFFLRELVWKDDDYRSRLFKDKVPFWVFDNDLLELAKYLGIKGCCQVSDVEFKYYHNQGEYKIWSEKVQNLRPYIDDFLKSPILCGEHGQEKSAMLFNQVSVYRAKELEMKYRLKGISVNDPHPRQSFLKPMDSNQEVTLWLGLEPEEGIYPDLIGDALQDHFGINQLREFVKDLLLTTSPHKTTLLSWEQRGFVPDLCKLPPESDSEEDESNLSESIDEKLPSGTGSEDDLGTNNSDVGTPTGDEDSETGDENSGSTGGESDTPPRRPRPGGGGARWPGGSGSSTPNRNRAAGYGRGGGKEGEKHRTLKEYLADNSSLFGEGLKLVDTEYRFRSGDEADILFEDSSGNPVTVEVKPPISSGSDQEVWQAVKYKHLAAVKYSLPCEQVRSILAAPEIPEDVKEKCKELGIEPIEVSNQTEA